MHIINHKPNRTIWIDEKEYLFFSGTSYLGLSESVDFQQLIKQGLDIYGASFGSSRNGNLCLEIYEQAEKKLAGFLKAPAAVTLSSGMLAGQAIINQLAGHEFIYSPQNHPANWHLPAIQSPKIPFDEWAEKLITGFPKSDTPKVIVCNSVDALRLEPLNFNWTDELPDNQEITLLIDDSHGLGILGENGEGIYSKIKYKPNVRLVVTASLHKAMGIAGGVICSDKAFIELISESIYFSACSPIAPAWLWAYMNSGELYQKQLLKLQKNIVFFYSQILDNKLFNSLKNYPVFWTRHNELYEYLFEKNIFIYHFTYPAKTGQTNTRIVLNAWHKADDILKLAEYCNKFGKKL